jgi:hypothetical protein
MKKSMLILSVAFILIFLQGCTLNDEEFLWDFALAWAEANPISAASRALTGSSGDDQVDAALDAYDSIKSLREADKLMERGKVFRDFTDMDDAIDKRPNDWSYRVSRSVLHLEFGDIDRFEDDRWEAEELAADSPGGLSQLNDQMIAELKDYLDRRRPSGDQCRNAHRVLSNEYNSRYNRTENPDDRAQANSHAAQIDHCGD